MKTRPLLSLVALAMLLGCQSHDTLSPSRGSLHAMGYADCDKNEADVVLSLQVIIAGCGVVDSREFYFRKGPLSGETSDGIIHFAPTQVHSSIIDGDGFCARSSIDFSRDSNPMLVCIEYSRSDWSGPEQKRKRHEWDFRTRYKTIPLRDFDESQGKIRVVGKWKQRTAEPALQNPLPD